jgi:hypothetical protein
MTALALDTPTTATELSPAFLTLLRQLHRAGVASYWWTASEAKDAKNQPKYKHSHWWLVDAPAVLPSDQHPRFGPLHLYFGVFPTGATKTPHRRAEIPDVVALTALYAEFDCKDFPSPEACHEHVLSLDPAASACLFSGGGYQTFWLLDEPLLLEDEATRKHAQDLLEAWVVLVGGDQQAKDLSRVLRVPGTINYKAKYGPDYPTAELVWCEPELTYPLAELEALAAPFLAEKPRPQREARESDRTYSLSDDIAQAIKNLDRLSRSRADDYNDWLAVGMALTPLAATGLQLWDDWSSKSEKYVQGECDAKWKTFSLDPHGLAKLGAWANADDPQVTLPALRPSKHTASRGNPAASEGDPASASDPVVEEGDDEAATRPELQMPDGYRHHGGVLQYQRGERWITFFSGLLRVDAIGTDIATGETTYHISWNGKSQPGTLTAPKRAIASSRGLLERAAAFQIPLHEGNAKYCAAFLVELANENAAIIPHELVSDRYGYIQSDDFGELLVLPAGVVGSNMTVRYAGEHATGIGSQATAYHAALKQLMGWNAPVATLLLALSLAAPIVARMRPRRNPVAHLYGHSDIGKTSAVQFALGCWGMPAKRPFTIVAAAATEIGVQQAMAHQMGLPLCIDEAHMATDPVLLERTIYNFANCESRTTGSLNGKAQGGHAIHGLLILTGEASSELRNAGSNNRLAGIDGNRYPPLGKGTIGKPGTPEHALGEQRSQLLAEAVANGAGLFGFQVAERVWATWEQVVQQVKTHQQNPAVRSLNTWGPALAMAFTALGVACDVAGIPAPPPTLLDEWVAILQAGRAAADPARNTFEEIRELFAAAVDSQQHGKSGWEVREVLGEAVAFRTITTLDVPSSDWRIPTGTDLFKRRVGPSAVQKYGQTWVRLGLVEPAKDGSASQTQDHVGKTRKCLVIPDDILTKGAGLESDDGETSEARG